MTTATQAPDTILTLRENIARVFLGHSAAIDRVICCVLARGHVLIEDVPGVGKTVLAQALARSLDCSFSRIQLTPDMLPADVLGVSILDRATNEFHFKPGPIFANIVLADEINRTPPRTQTAMLEAMNEATVSIDGRTLILDPPFMVVATQNPYDFEGTYPLPENQLDRFLMRISVGYPSPEDEARVLAVRPAATALHQLTPVLSKHDIISLQERTDEVRVEPALLDYIVAFANATRRHEAVQVGLSPRGSLALAQATRASALFAGRDYAIPEDVIANIPPVCAHRIVLRPTYGSAPDSAARVLARVLETVPSPA